MTNQYPIIKNFQISAPSDDSIPCTLSWDYISLPGGFKSLAGSIVVPDPDAQYLLLVNGPVVTLVDPETYVPAGEYVTAWIVGLDIFSKWFYSADFPPELQNLATDSTRLWGKFLMPSSRGEHWGLGSKPAFVPINSADLTQGFHHSGNNYPGPGLSSGLSAGDIVEYIDKYPGYKLLPPTTSIGPLVKVIEPQSYGYNNTSGEITSAILYEFALEISKQEFSIKNYWTAHLGSDQNTSLWGLDREPWLSILSLAPELKPWLVLAATPSERLYPSDPVWVSTDYETYSQGSYDSWQWRYIITKNADIGLDFYDIKNALLGSIPPGLPNSIDSFNGLPIANLLDSWQPEIDLTIFTTLPTPAQFQRGYSYRFAAGTPLPVDLILTSPTTGIYPRDTALAIAAPNTRHRGIFNSKLTLDTVHWLFDLCKFTQGRTFATGTLDEISIGPEDLQYPLRLWQLPPQYVDTALLDFKLGHENNEAHVKLPLFYRRDGVMWRLAQAICRAIVPLEALEIGYHLFTADYSVADEPIYQELEAVELIFSLSSITDNEDNIGTQFYYIQRPPSATLPYQPVTVQFQLTGSATEGVDYTLNGLTLVSPGLYEVTLGPFDYSVSSIYISVNADTDIEPNENILLTPVPSAFWTSVSATAAGITIVNDDFPVPVSLGSGNGILESASGTTAITASVAPFGATAARNVTLNFLVSGTATFGTDYTVSAANGANFTFSATNASIEIPAGTGSVSFLIDPINESLVEPNETVTLTLIPSPATYTLTGTNTATVTILNDDVAAPATIHWQIPTIPVYTYPNPYPLNINYPS